MRASNKSKRRKCNKSSSWGGRRANTGGARKGSGRPRKYDPIILSYRLDKKTNLIRALSDLSILLLENRIDVPRARALAYIFSHLAQLVIPDEIEEKLNELEERAAKVEEELKPIMDQEQRA